jgi:hypothetical protein
MEIGKLHFNVCLRFLLSHCNTILALRHILSKTKLRGLSPQANYTERPPLVGEDSANLCG